MMMMMSISRVPYAFPRTFTRHHPYVPHTDRPIRTGTDHLTIASYLPMYTSNPCGMPVARRDDCAAGVWRLLWGMHATVMNVEGAVGMSRCKEMSCFDIGCECGNARFNLRWDVLFNALIRVTIISPIVTKKTSNTPEGRAHGVRPILGYSSNRLKRGIDHMTAASRPPSHSRASS